MKYFSYDITLIIQSSYYNLINVRFLQSECWIKRFASQHIECLKIILCHSLLVTSMMVANGNCLNYDTNLELWMMKCL